MSGWVRDGHFWLHRPWWKVAINTVLRALQRGRKRKWVVYTKCGRDDTNTSPPTVVGYGFGPVDYR